MEGLSPKIPVVYFRGVQDSGAEPEGLHHLNHLPEAAQHEVPGNIHKEAKKYLNQQLKMLQEKRELLQETLETAHEQLEAALLKKKELQKQPFSADEMRAVEQAVRASERARSSQTESATHLDRSIRIAAWDIKALGQANAKKVQRRDKKQESRALHKRHKKEEKEKRANKQLQNTSPGAVGLLSAPPLSVAANTSANTSEEGVDLSQVAPIIVNQQIQALQNEIIHTTQSTIDTTNTQLAHIEHTMDHIQHTIRQLDRQFDQLEPMAQRIALIYDRVGTVYQAIVTVLGRVQPAVNVLTPLVQQTGRGLQTTYNVIYRVVEVISNARAGTPAITNTPRDT